MSFGKLIRQARKEAGLTQQELGERTGNGKPYICMVEKGKQTLSETKAHEILAAMGRELMYALKPKP